MSKGFYSRFCPVMLVALLCAGCSVMSAPVYEGEVTDYVVKRGDTLFDIAGSCGMHVDLLADLNELDHPERLSIGQVLKVPVSARAVLARSKPGDMNTFRAPQPEPKEVVPPLELNGSPAAASFGRLIWPVSGGEFGSRFGTRDGNFHEGIDIRACTGTPVYAAHDGEVVFSGNAWSGYGNMIVIRGGGIYTVYAHNHQNFVETGDTVEQGDEIASVGKTGRASGSHLHFEVRVDDSLGLKVAVNPVLFLKRNTRNDEPVVAAVSNQAKLVAPPPIAADGEHY